MGVARSPHYEDIADLEAGDTVGPYRILSRLGEGGMGLVYKAVGSDGEEVALKLVRGKLAADQVFRKRFDREAGAARRGPPAPVVPGLHTRGEPGVPHTAPKFHP